MDIEHNKYRQMEACHLLFGDEGKLVARIYNHRFRFLSHIPFVTARPLIYDAMLHVFCLQVADEDERWRLGRNYVATAYNRTVSYERKHMDIPDNFIGASREQIEEAEMYVDALSELLPTLTRLEQDIITAILSIYPTAAEGWAVFFSPRIPHGVSPSVCEDLNICRTRFGRSIAALRPKLMAAVRRESMACCV